MGLKLTYEFVKEQFAKREYKLLETEYINCSTKMRYICSIHPDEIQTIDYDHLKQGCGCKKCGTAKRANARKLDFDVVKNAFIEKGYTLLDTTYINSKTKMKYVCNKHSDITQEMSYEALRGGIRCRLCSKESYSQKRKLPYEYIKQQFNLKGYTLLSENYEGCEQKLQFMCNTHTDIIQEVSWAKFVHGQGCHLCTLERIHHEKALSYDYVKNEFTTRGYTLLEEKYNNAREKMAFICNKHPETTQYITYNQLQQGGGCKKCHNYKRYTYEEVKDVFDSLNYDLLDLSYQRYNKKMQYRCRKHSGEVQEITLGSILHGGRCKYCTGKGTSYPEQFLYYMLLQHFSGAQNRCCINNLEYDMYIPEIRCAIEYDGYYYHQNKDNHNVKIENCKSENIFFIRVIESKEESAISVDNNNIYIRSSSSRSVKSLEKLYHIILQLINQYYLINLLPVSIEQDINLLILKRLKGAEKEKSLIEEFPELAQEWNYEKNKNLIPEYFTKGSTDNVWWVCSSCGHEWKANIDNRVKGKGCSECNSVKRRIVQLSNNKKYIEEFESLSAAARSVNVSPSGIWAACNFHHKCHGYYWMYKEDYEEWIRLAE